MRPGCPRTLPTSRLDVASDDPDSPHVDEPPIEPADQVDPTAARGPHLPERWPAWVFVALAVAALWVSFLEATTTTWTLETAISFVLGVVPPVSSVLLPAALLMRHPDATHRARALLFGILLFASVPLFRAIEGSLQDWFNELTPASRELSWLVPLALLYAAFVTLVGLFGVLYMGFGLSKARHYLYSRGARTAGLVILFVAAVVAAARIWSVSQLDLSGVPMTPDVITYIASTVILGVLTILAWAYLAMTVTRCAMSGEEPVAGWSVAAIGTCLIAATFAIGAWSSVVQTTNESVQTVIFWLSTIMYSLGFLGLLGGFALGIPSLEPGDWDDEDEPDTEEVDGADDADDEDDEDEDDEDDDAEESAA